MNENTTTTTPPSTLTLERAQTSDRSLAVLAPSNFELAQRMATALSKSNLIPQAFQNNLPNCLIALEMSQRMGIPAMMVMQNLYVVHGKPAWSSQFVIAAINSTGRFSPLRFQITGEGDARTCIAWAVELGTRERLEGPPVTIDMAKREGWYNKNGSKWQTMPELMLRYRSATFFGRLYAPEVLMGMREEGEIIDVEATPVISGPTNLPPVVNGDDANGKPPAEKPTPRHRAKKAKEETPPATPPPQTAADQIRAKLAEGNYTEENFIKVAISNMWCDTTTKKIEDIEEGKLKVFLEDWDNTLLQLAELKPSDESPLD